MKNINQIVLAENNQINVSSDFNDHLISLFRFPFEEKSIREGLKKKQLIWDLANYESFSQFSLENSYLIEDKEGIEPDWNWIDEERNRLKKHLQNLLGKEAHSEYLKPIIDHTLIRFDNYLSYNAMHPNSQHNPWINIYKILTEKGYLFLATDEKEMAKEYLGKKYQDNSAYPLTFITSSKPKNPRTNPFRQFLVKNFCEVELKVLDYLQTEALGFENAKSMQTIQHFLIEKHKMRVSTNQIKSIIKYLKQNGYIGSEEFRGYFVIISENDLIKTYQHDAQQVQDLERTMKIYEKKAKAMGFHQFAEKIQRI